MELLVSITPFLISFLLELASPWVEKLWKGEFRARAERLENASFISPDITNHFVDFTEHALGKIQMLSAFMITFIGGSVQLFFQQLLGVLGLLVLLLIVAYISYSLYTGDPYDFAAKSEKWHYSPAAIYGMIVNILFILIIIFI